MKYILTYNINDYCENGGGNHFELFDSKQEIEIFLDKNSNPLFSILGCYEIREELKLEQVTTVTKWKIKE